MKPLVCCVCDCRFKDSLEVARLARRHFFHNSAATEKYTSLNISAIQNLFIRLTVYLFIYLFVYLFVCLFVYLFVCLFVCLFIYLVS